MDYVGKILGNRYEIIEEIGSGGMATVYKAKCKLLNRYVAIKVLRDEFADDTEFIKRFQIEAQAAASLSHPNIVSIYDVGNENGTHYIVMELIEGKTLKEVINEKGKLPWRDAVNIAIQIASGLNQAHKNHIVHRDIKPHNIIITKDGTAKVTDFGIAKAVSNSTINAFGSTIGSVHYFSPEHARGGYTDEKSDIYSLGVVLYEMCTGKLPFDGETPVTVALKHLQEYPVEAKSLEKDLPNSVNKIIVKAMQKETSERYQSAEEMLKDLQQSLKNPEVVIDKLDDTRDYSTQKIPAIKNNVRVAPNEKKIDKNLKNEQEDVDMGNKKKKMTKSKALVRLLIILAILALVFWGCMALGEFVTVKVLGNPVTSSDVPVPNIIGYKLDEAKKVLEDAGLSIGMQTEVTSEQYPKGYVVWQRYSEGYKLKSGSSVDVNISKGQKTVLVPNVENASTTALARTQIQAVGLVYAESGEYSSVIPSGEIIRQDPLFNNEVPEGSTVTVYISMGPNEDGLVKVPSLIGLTEKEAEALLAEYKLTGLAVYSTKSSAESGKIFDQVPVADTYVSELTEVTYTVNKTTDEKVPEEDTKDPTEHTETPAAKKKITLDLSSCGTRDTFVVTVVVEGQTIGKKVEYEANHKRSDGKINVLVSDVKGALLKVYIDGTLTSEMVLD